MAALNGIEYRLADLAGDAIAATTGNLVLIDRDAAELGWFVDLTPLDEEEFSESGQLGLLAMGGAAAGGIDLLTVLIHEQGHVLGLPDLVTAGDLMNGFIAEGQRRLPVLNEASQAQPGDAGETHYLTNAELDNPDSLGNRGANYTRQVNSANSSPGLVSVITVAATVTPTVVIDLGTGTQLNSGNGEDVLIRVVADRTAIAMGGGTQPSLVAGAVIAKALIGGSTTVSFGGEVSIGGNLTVELQSANEAVALGEALSIGIVNGAGVDTRAEVSPTIATYLAPGSHVTVGGDFVLRTLSDAGATATSKGIAVAAGLAVGVSLANATVKPTVSTYVGDDASIDAQGGITIETLHNVDAVGHTLDRKASADGRSFHRFHNFIGLGREGRCRCVGNGENLCRRRRYAEFRTVIGGHDPGACQQSGRCPWRRLWRRRHSRRRYCACRC